MREEWIRRLTLAAFRLKLNYRGNNGCNNP